MYPVGMDKKIYNIGILAYPVLIILAALFYKERTILLDNSLFLFEILKDDTFTVQRHRFIAAIPQVLPLLAAKLSLSLKWVMVFYAASFAVYHFVCYLLCGVVLKNYRLGVVLLVVNTLIVTHTFFWGLSELLLGLSLILPFFALIIDTERKIPAVLLWFFLAVGTVTICFSHPLAVFPFVFISAFVFISPGIRVNRILLVAINIGFVLIAVAKKKLLADAYESESIELLRNFKKLFPDYFSTYSNIHFVETWFSMYYWLPVLFVIVIATYVSDRKWLKMLLVLGACVGYSQIVNIAYPTYLTHEFYKENMYTSLGLFLALPLVYDVFPRWNKNLVVSVFVLILITSFVRIGMKQDFYAGRIDWYRGYLDKYGDEKMMVPMGDKPAGTILLPWSSPYEFWLISTLERDKTASIIINNNIESVSWAYDNYRAFVTEWGIFKYKDLNPRYFKFTDTSRHYSVYMDR